MLTMSIIENAQAKLANTTDPSEKANLEATIKYARQARVHKILNNPAYNKYIDTMVTPEVEETENARQFNKQIDSSEKMALAGYEHEDKLLANKNQQEKDMANITNQAKIDAYNAEADATIKASEAAYDIEQRKIAAADERAERLSAKGYKTNNLNADLSNVKIANNTDMYGRYVVNGSYYTAEEIARGLQDGTFYYKDEGNGKIGIYSNTGEFIG